MNGQKFTLSFQILELLKEISQFLLFFINKILFVYYCLHWIYQFILNNFFRSSEMHEWNVQVVNLNQSKTDVFKHFFFFFSTCLYIQYMYVRVCRYQCKSNKKIKIFFFVLMTRILKNLMCIKCLSSTVNFGKFAFEAKWFMNKMPQIFIWF